MYTQKSELCCYAFANEKTDRPLSGAHGKSSQRYSTTQSKYKTSLNILCVGAQQKAAKLFDHPSSIRRTCKD